MSRVKATSLRSAPIWCGTMSESRRFCRDEKLEESMLSPFGDGDQSKVANDNGEGDSVEVSFGKCIGTGASGSVFEGFIKHRDESKSRTRVALKSMRPAVLQKNAKHVLAKAIYARKGREFASREDVPEKLELCDVSFLYSDAADILVAGYRIVGGAFEELSLSQALATFPLSSKPSSFETMEMRNEAKASELGFTFYQLPGNSCSTSSSSSLSSSPSTDFAYAYSTFASAYATSSGKTKDGRRVSVPAAFIPDNLAAFLVKRNAARREALMMKLAESSHTVRLIAVAEAYDMENEKCAPLLVMEHMPGGDLFSLIETRGALPEDVGRKIFRAVANALSDMHSKGMSHSDMKMENVLLREEDGEQDVKLADFGLSILRAPGATVDEDELFYAGLSTKVRRGTPAYFAPEQFVRERCNVDPAIRRVLRKVNKRVFGKRGCLVDPSPAEIIENGKAADVYGLGLILFAMLSGYPPFSCKPWTCQRMHSWALDRVACKDVLAEQIGPNWLFEAELSRHARHLLCSMLHPDPSQRIGINEVLASPWLYENAEGKGTTPIVEASAGSSSSAATAAAAAAAATSASPLSTSAFGPTSQRLSGDSIIDESASVHLSDTEDGAQEDRNGSSVLLVLNDEESKEEEVVDDDEEDGQDESHEEQKCQSPEEKVSKQIEGIVTPGRKARSDPESPTSVCEIEAGAFRKTCSMGTLESQP